MKKYTHLLFDLDNTLFDFTSASNAALSQLFETYGIPTEENHFNRYKAINKEVWIRFQRGEISASELKAERWKLFLNPYGIQSDPHSVNENYLDLIVTHSELYPGTEFIIQLLSESYVLLACTNGLTRVQKARLQKTNTLGYFEEVFISEEMGIAKPQVGYFDQVFDSIGEEFKSTSLMIGDSLNSDILGARNVGIDSVWYNPMKLSVNPDISPTYTIEDLHQLIKIVL